MRVSLVRPDLDAPDLVNGASFATQRYASSTRRALRAVAAGLMLAGLGISYKEGFVRRMK